MRFQYLQLNHHQLETSWSNLANRSPQRPSLLGHPLLVEESHNGLVCAAYLAKAGLDVLVLERRHMVGGACATEEIFPGCHVSTCSYVVYTLQDKIVQDLELRKHGYDVHNLPVRRLFPLPGWTFADLLGRQLDTLLHTTLPELVDGLFD